MLPQLVVPVKHSLRRLSSDEREVASKLRLRDVIGPGLDVLFCGINPGLYSATAGHHFAGPGNRFWPALFASGFTPRLFAASDDRELLSIGLGITNIVERTTSKADLLAPIELRGGARRLRRRVLKHKPLILAVVGIGAFRTAFAAPDAQLGLQPSTIGSTRIWLLPNPSGLNAHHQPASLAKLFSELRGFASAIRSRPHTT